VLSVEFLYAAAANAGLLKSASIGDKQVFVDLRAPDEDVLGGMGISRDYAIRYPLAWLPALAAGSELAIGGNTYRVREVLAMGDGSEMRAQLTQL